MGKALLAWAGGVAVIELHDCSMRRAIGVDGLEGHLPRVTVGLVFETDFIFGDGGFEAAVALADRFTAGKQLHIAVIMGRLAQVTADKGGAAEVLAGIGVTDL